MQTVARDRNGVEGMPMTLLITAVILAITVPIIFGSLRTYDRGRVEAELVSELDRFTAMAQFVYVSGPGNSAVIGFTAAGGLMTGVDYVILGDVSGGELASTVRYRLGGQDEKAFAVTSPNVPMFSDGGTVFELASGTYSILAECVSDGDGAAAVRLSVVT